MIKLMVGNKEMFIRGDSKQWVIGKMVHDKKKGKDSFVGESFYSSTEGMVRGALELKLRTSDANSLSELQQNLKTIKDELRGLYDTSTT